MAFACRAVVLRPESRGNGRARVGRSHSADAHSAEFPEHGERPQDAGGPASGWSATSARQPALRALRRQGAQPPVAECNSDGDYRRSHPRHGGHRPSSARHLQDGPGQRRHGRRRRRAPGQGRGRACRVVDASVMPDLVGGNIKRAGHHDRGEGGRSDLRGARAAPRRIAAAGGGGRTRLRSTWRPA